MAATPEQVAALESALYSGVLSVTYNGRTVTYPSADDLAVRLSQARAELAAASGAPPKPRCSFVSFSKG